MEDLSFYLRIQSGWRTLGRRGSQPLLWRLFCNKTLSFIVHYSQCPGNTVLKKIVASQWTSVKLGLLNIFVSCKETCTKHCNASQNLQYQVAPVFSVTFVPVNNCGILLFHRITSCFLLLWTKLSDYGTYQEENVSAVSSI